jgi:hypothetical protein
VNEIGSHEKQWVVHYIEQGLEVLNSASSIGAIGKTRIFWTFERCQAEAKKYKTKKAFRQVSSSAYTAAQKQGWLEKISSHLTSATKPNGYWTKDKCAAEAKKHGSKAAFKRDASNAYSAALRQGWLEKISSHLTTGKKPNGYWTKAKCHEEALKYSTKKEFKQSCGSAYSTALREGWKDEICQHMRRPEPSQIWTTGKKPNGYWTKAKCHEEALKYSTKKEFKQSCGSAYSTALREGWKDEICQHM